MLCKTCVWNWSSYISTLVHFDTEEAQFKVFQEYLEGFSPLAQMERFQEDVGPRTGESEVDPVIRSRNNTFDTALQTLAGFIISALHSSLGNPHLFQLLDKLLLE